ncbi:M1 family metallopeptidase [Ilyomonas limi]|uniref:M1 family metallopeptidase n=1 Tax=Ilyomonas limi TaxID=2575867 RepID=A0A4V5UU60_9BACT|nr:M1 family metallopeptidase [Ilyomonas limi]TKK67393.1 M1 family metallopeptidase [Ilyomonas limi]
MMRLVIGCILSFFFLEASSQGLYMPRNIKQAYLRETRSVTGRPGDKYWQNYGRYNISITAQPPSRTIRGTEQIVYFNRSTDTLQYLVIRIIPNIHRPGAVRYTPADSNYLTSGVHIDSFAINGALQTWEEDYYHNTVYPVKLPAALHPGDSVHLDVAWHYDVSLKSGREGMLDSTTFYIAYFYPRVSVYDDYNGWDDVEFVDYQEFYNDFNDYTLSVTVPKNYIVWATGTLQNADAVLQPLYNKRLQASMTSDSVIHIATLQELLSKKVTAQNKLNTWRWTADNITDVTVAISDHYVWDASSVVVDDATHRRASMQAAYNDTAQDFRHMVEFGKHALSWFSHHWPGVPYPYPKMTAVQGYADMEYPMMINDSHTPNPDFTRFVAEHEIAHTYFPFYMGINETRYPFMDEGWATTLEYLIGIADVGKDRADDLYKNFRIVNWIYDLSDEEDLPIITPANVLRGSGYGNNAYGKPSLAYLALKDMLGDDVFRKCLHEYMDRWHGKHPIPWDFFFTFNDVSGNNLNWFWNNWFFSNGYIDIAVQNVVHNANDNTIFVQNTGGFPVPFDVRIRYTDGSTDSLHQTATTWSANQKAAAVIVPGNKTIQAIRLDNGIFMDADERNNTWKSK